MMNRQRHSDATSEAHRLFEPLGFQPEVYSNGKGVYEVTQTPFGRVGLVRVNQGHAFLVAAESPPFSLLSEGSLPDQLQAYFRQKQLVPWRLVETSDICNAIRQLAIRTNDGSEDAEFLGPYVCPFPTAVPVIGDNRIRFCERIGVAMLAEAPRAPLPQLVGVDGIGKRSLLATAAQQNGLSLRGELPLERIFIERTLQTSMEVFLDWAISHGRMLENDEVLVVSDAEVLGTLGSRERSYLLRELSRLPHVMLLARSMPSRDAMIVPLYCPALETAEDAEGVVDSEMSEKVSFAGSAFQLLVRAASIPGIGVVPGRLLYLIRLAKAFLGGETDSLFVHNTEEGTSEVTVSPSKQERMMKSVTLSPDEVTAAVELAKTAWDDSNHPAC